VDGAGGFSEGQPGHGTGADECASQVVMILLRLFRALERVDTGLTPQQYRILKLAGAGGERSAKLAERLAVAKPTLTATADGLVAAGYARRDAEPGDRRVVRLCLTASGREAVEVRTRLPEVEHAPTTFYWTGRVKNKSIRWVSVRVDHGL